MTKRIFNSFIPALLMLPLGFACAVESKDSEAMGGSEDEGTGANAQDGDTSEGQSNDETASSDENEDGESGESGSSSNEDGEDGSEEGARKDFGVDPLSQIWYVSNAAHTAFLIDLRDELPFISCNSTGGPPGPPVSVSGGMKNTASLTHPETGELILYSDGITVFNGESHLPLEGGTNLGADYLTSESVLAAPFPGATLENDNQQYYLFVNKGRLDNLAYLDVYDLDLSQGANGSVVQKRSLMQGILGESLDGIPHPNGKDYWVLAFDSLTKLRAFPVTTSGISGESVDSETGLNPADNINGNLIHAPDYSRLYLQLFPNYIQGADPEDQPKAKIVTATMDRETGEVTAFETVTEVGYFNRSSITVSPDGKKVYYADQGSPFQYDIETGETVQLSRENKVSGMSLGHNGKIYMGQSGWSTMPEISNPDAAGYDANYYGFGMELSPCTPGFGLAAQMVAPLDYVTPFE